jgi:hypothetical protein
VGEVEVEEDGGDNGRIGQKREDLHLGAAAGTEERQHIVDPREQDGPADSGGGGGLRRRLSSSARFSASEDLPVRRIELLVRADGVEIRLRVPVGRDVEVRDAPVREPEVGDRSGITEAFARRKSNASGSERRWRSRLAPPVN